MPESAPPTLPRWMQAAVPTLVVAVFVLACRPSLSWGLWLDETTLAWQAEAGWALARDRLGETGNSALFGYIEALFYFPGPHMEVWLRVPALLGALASFFLIQRLAEMFLGKGTGLLAMVSLAGTPLMLTYATQARPYSLALAACLVTLWGVARWLDTGSRRYGLLFSVAFALAVHLHFLFGVFAVVPAFLVWRHARGKQPVHWRELGAWAGLSALLLLPLLPLLRRLSRFPDPSALPIPTLADLAEVLIPSTVLLSLVAFAFLLVPPNTRRRALDGLRAPGARPTLAFAWFWFLVPPLVLFVASHLIRKTILIDRYVLHIVAAQALIVAALFRGFPPIVATLALLACFLPYPVLYGIQSSSRADGPLSWRLPLEAVRALDPTGAAPVFVQSGHPPTNAMDWPHGIERRLLDYAPLAAYPVPNRTYPLPYTLDENVRTYVRRVSDTELAQAPVIFVAGLAEHSTIQWVRQFFEARGYTASFGVRQALWLLVFRRTDSTR